MAQTDVIPGIFEKTLEDLEQKIAVVAGVSKWIHIDIADNTLVPVTTPLDPSRYQELISRFPGMSFEAHLMVANPEKYIRPLVDAGFLRLIVHVESNDPRRFLETARYDDVEVGIAIDGATEVEQVEPFLEEVEFAVVSTKEMGGDGPFLPEAVERIRLIRQNYPDLPIEAVGGIDDTNAKIVREAGATRIVSTGYIFRQPDMAAEAIKTLAEA